MLLNLLVRLRIDSRDFTRSAKEEEDTFRDIVNISMLITQDFFPNASAHLWYLGLTSDRLQPVGDKSFVLSSANHNEVERVGVEVEHLTATELERLMFCVSCQTWRVRHCHRCDVPLMAPRADTEG